MATTTKTESQRHGLNKWGCVGFTSQAFQGDAAGWSSGFPASGPASPPLSLCLPSWFQCDAHPCSRRGEGEEKGTEHLPLCVRKAKAFLKIYPANLDLHVIDRSRNDGRARQPTVFATSADRVTVRTEELACVEALCMCFRKVSHYLYPALYKGEARQLVSSNYAVRTEIDGGHLEGNGYFGTSFFPTKLGVILFHSAGEMISELCLVRSIASS